MRLLAPAPVDRYPSLESLRWDLDHWQDPDFLAASARLRSQIAEPTLVGRQHEIEQLVTQKGLIQALAPPGMGKTRLLEEATRRALAEGWTVWRAECLQSSHRSYQPFQELAAQLARRPELWPALEAKLGDWLPAVLRLFPAWRPLSGVAPQESGSEDSLHDRNREASLHLLQAMGPAIFVVDDLHWAQEEVVECLSRLPWPVWAASRVPISRALHTIQLQPLKDFEVDLLAFTAVQAGVQAFMVKDALPEEVLAATLAVAHGCFYLDSRVAPAFLLGAEVGEKRQANILSCLRAGLSNQEIAERTHLSLSSVKAELRVLFEHYGVKDRKGLLKRLNSVI